MSASNSNAASQQSITNQQVGIGSGGGGVGSNSNGNIINVTTSDIHALEANQHVSETAINATASTAAYAIQAVEQAQSNQTVFGIHALDVGSAEQAQSEAVVASLASQFQAALSETNNHLIDLTNNSLQLSQQAAALATPVSTGAGVTEILTNKYLWLALSAVGIAVVLVHYRK